MQWLHRLQHVHAKSNTIPNVFIFGVLQSVMLLVLARNCTHAKCLCWIAENLHEQLVTVPGRVDILSPRYSGSSLSAVLWERCAPWRGSTVLMGGPPAWRSCIHKSKITHHSKHLQFLINKAGGSVPSQQYHYHGDTRKQNLDDTQWLSSSHLVDVFISSAFRSKLQSVGMQGLIEQIKFILSPGYLTYQHGFFQVLQVKWKTSMLYYWRMQNDSCS